MEGSLRRLLAIGFAAKESSDVDDPHDHSVADAIASFEAAPETKAITGEMRAFRATQGAIGSRRIPAAG